MFAGILSLSLCSALVAVPDRAPLGETITPDIEKEWHDQLRRNGRVTIKLKKGEIVLHAKVVLDRRLKDVVIRWDDNEGRDNECPVVAKEAEIRFDAGRNRLVLRLRDGCARTADSSISFGELVLPFELPRR
jgi:hypothetical protein